ncbi:protein translocase subunit secY/sec61 alpha [Lishizhenia tianjinensis]|uniref:Protein translocase subunit SecY n=1 Tax=Lishizhenia tianjinensis TaxID=477690 RepID=A0A1I7A6Y3_9FLAO|nr:preprotein translocase subunit SecY [Lishizhenia tianjinensis]SFT70689.1 protein translocase subunit secY/sec61 alpha [Lishizhenia tianjinensis]
MKKFIQNIKNIWKVEELRKRLVITLSLILVYRIGCYIVLPGVDSSKLTSDLSESAGTFEGLLGLLSGGGFTNASFLALGIMPYISASIIMQLLGMAVPAVQKMQSEGESGRKKINNYTRILTIIICAVQAPTYIGAYVGSKGAIPAELMSSPIWWVQSVMVLVGGAMFAVWLGERITDKGVGNGISLLITVGILARFPQAVFAEAIDKESPAIPILLEIVCFMAIVLATVLIVQGVRKVPMNYAKRVASGRAEAGDQSARSYLPIKVNASGVMPIIFAQAIMAVPVMVFDASTFGIFGFWYNLVLAVLIVVFTYFYTAIMINPKKMADDMKRSGGFIPGIRPGEETANYIDALVSRITLPGSIFLALIAVLPAVAYMAGVGQAFALFFGGTSLLIMVGVVLDTLQQIETYLLNRHYDGLMEGTKIRGRRTAGEVSGF